MERIVPEYIAYFDESGDHGLLTIDPTFPIFVLCCSVFKIEDFVQQDQPALSRIKFSYFGHDAVILHSREIRKRVGAFQILTDPAVKTRFVDDISNFFRNSTCTLIAAAINKDRHLKKYRFPDDPYEISLLFCLERLYAFLADRGKQKDDLTCVFERRGRAEDATLASQFTRICAGENRWGRLPFRAVFADKQTNMIGLQIADLAAYPIARHCMNPTGPNPAYDAIEPRLRRSTGGKVDGYGLKSFP